MKTRILFLAAMAAMVFAVASCSSVDDDNPSNSRAKVPDPEGAVELNIRNSSNGATVLRNYP